jgi:starvation-inducible outer membrane lipoprotein
MTKEVTNMREAIRSSGNDDRGMNFKGKMRCRTGATLVRWASLWLLIFFLAGLAGCMHSISKGVMATVDKDRTFSAVIQDPEANVGSTVLWGGVIEKVFHESGETKLIVSQAPLNSKGYPQTEATDREFVAHTPQFLDPQTFHNGMKVTIAGEIDGVEEKELGPEKDPRPMVRVIEIHAWTENRWGWGSFRISRGWELNLNAPSVQGLNR